MKNKKFFAKALAFAMVMGTVGVHSAAVNPVALVQAAEPAAAFDESTYELTITDAANKYVCLQVLKDAQGTKVSSEYWYPVAASPLKVDLSFLKATKKQYIRVYANDVTQGSIVEIPAQPKTVIKFDAKTQKFVDKSKVEITDLTGYDYKTLYGSAWKSDMSSYSISQASIAGTTLIIRQSADSTKKVPAGTEVKVKISAAAKAPKVKVDYKKGIITLPKGVEVGITANLQTAVADSAWVKIADGGKFTQADLLTKLGKSTSDAATLKGSGYVLLVKTSAVDGKKAASNIAVVNVNKTPVIANSSGTITNSTVTGGGDKVVCTFTADDTTLTVSGTTTWAYSLDDGKKWTVIDGTAKIAVKKGEKFKVYVPAGDDSFASDVLEVTNTAS